MRAALLALLLAVVCLFAPVVSAGELTVAAGALLGLALPPLVRNF